ncbi:MAG TPA: hypothetical protein VNO32_13495 [Candidatus Acidoferrum sp.]|nr:hypothetical protein [Candidatus Acidoferrum sp.]
MSVQVSTPIYRKKGVFYKDSVWTQPFTDQAAARVLWRQKHGEPFVDVIKRWASGFVFLFLIGGCIAFWNFTEKQGWRSHDQLARVSASEWAQGEYKSCATSVHPDDIYLVCDDATNPTAIKVFKVRFYGESKTDKNRWNCRKLEGDPAISCEKMKLAK